MKKSLSKNVLVLSLAALAALGSGCERRGRAPVPVKDGPTEPAPTNPLKAVPPTETPGKTPTFPTDADKKAGDKVSEQEMDVAVKDSGIVDCAIKIDTAATSSAESFAADYKLMNDLTTCLSTKYGVEMDQSAKDAAGNKTWPIVEAKLEPEFKKLAAAKDATDPSARETLNARLRVLELNVDKMNEKYGEENGRLKSLDEKNHAAVNAALADLNAVKKSCEAAKKIVDGYKTVSNGQDLTKSVNYDI